MIGNILCIALGYGLAQFVPMSKIREFIDRFRKDGVGDSDDWPGSA